MTQSHAESAVRKTSAPWPPPPPIWERDGPLIDDPDFDDRAAAAVIAELAELRRQLGWSYFRWGIESDLSRDTFRFALRRRSPGMKLFTVIRLVTAAGVPLGAFFARVDARLERGPPEA